jgi:hypothetical protein
MLVAIASTNALQAKRMEAFNRFACTQFLREKIAALFTSAEAISTSLEGVPLRDRGHDKAKEVESVFLRGKERLKDSEGRRSLCWVGLGFFFGGLMACLQMPWNYTVLTKTETNFQLF